MTAVTRYQSENGRTYEKPEDAVDQDKLFRLQNEVSRLLPQAVDESCRFANGGGYVQHTQEDVDLFKLGLEALIVAEFGEDSECLKFWRDGNHYAGRYLDDGKIDLYLNGIVTSKTTYHQVIVGGESGDHWKDNILNLDHMRHVFDQCRTYHVKRFAKQDSARLPGQRGRIPDDLWVQEVPV